MTVICPVLLAVQLTVFQMVWNSAMVPLHCIFFCSISDTCCLKWQLFICFNTLMNYLFCIWVILIMRLVHYPVSTQFYTELWAKSWNCNKRLYPLGPYRIFCFMASVTFSDNKTLPVPVSVTSRGHHIISYLFTITATWPKLSVLSYQPEVDWWFYL